MFVIAELHSLRGPLLQSFGAFEGEVGDRSASIDGVRKLISWCELISSSRRSPTVSQMDDLLMLIARRMHAAAIVEGLSSRLTLSFRLERQNWWARLQICS